MKKHGLISLAVLGSAIILMSGCASWLAPFMPEPTNAAPPSPTAQVSATIPSLPTVTPEPVDPIPGAVSITLWVPPQFNPESGTDAGDILQAQLDGFMEANPGVLVVTRVKSASGPGGLLEALTASVAAAPSAVPAVLALNRSDLEQAALKSLIFPLDGLTAAVENADWYAYSRQLGRIQNSNFGLPFAGDALIVVHRPAETGQPTPAVWEDIFSKNLVVIAPLDDTQAMVALALYRSAGGLIQDEQGRPTLEPEFLQPVLQNFQTGIGRGSFPLWLTELQTNGQAWQAFSESRGAMVVTWSSNFLADMPPDANVIPLPTLGDETYTLATGWSWVLSDNDPLTRDMSIKLMEHLSESDFLAEWTSAAGFLPTRPTVLAGWTNQSLVSVIHSIVLSAEVRPANELLASLGPVLREAVLSIFTGTVTPDQAAQTAVENLGQP